MHMKMSSFYIHVPKIKVIWCMLSEIWVQHNFLSFWVIFCPFTPLLAPKIKNLKKIRRYFLFCMCTINKDSWDIMRNRQKFLSFLVIFIPLTNQKSQFWEKKPGDIISLHLCTTNDNHMMYGSLDIRCNWQSFLWTIFCPFDPPKNLENQNFKKWKKNFLEISLFVP